MLSCKHFTKIIYIACIISRLLYLLASLILKAFLLASSLFLSCNLLPSKPAIIESL